MRLESVKHAGVRGEALRGLAKRALDRQRYQKTHDSRERMYMRALRGLGLENEKQMCLHRLGPVSRPGLENKMAEGVFWFCFWRQGLMQPWLISNMLCSQG